MFLASMQHLDQRGPFVGSDGQIIDRLDSYPHLGVGAVVRVCRYVSLCE